MRKRVRHGKVRPKVKISQPLVRSLFAASDAEDFQCARR